MPTQIAEQPTTTELAVIEAFEITKKQIDEAVSLADKATVAGPEDKDGMKLAHDYRMGLTKMRTGIDKKRRELKADVLERGRMIDKVAKELAEPIPPAEEKLRELEQTAKREQERLDAIAKQEREAEIKRRCDLANSVSWSIPINVLESMSTDDFERVYAEQRAAHETRERERQAAEEAQRKEQDRLDKLAAEQKERKAELARKEAAQRAQQKELEDALREAKLRLVAQRSAALAAVEVTMDADDLADLSNDDFATKLQSETESFEKRKAEEAKAAKARQEQAVKDAAEKAKREAQEEAERKERERLAAIEAEAEKKRKVAEAAKRKAAKAPDRDKVIVFRLAIKAIALPKLSKDSRHQQNRVEEVVNTVLSRLEAIADELA